MGEMILEKRGPQIYAYTEDTPPAGEGYAQYLQAFDLGDRIELVMRHRSGNETSIVLTSAQVADFINSIQ